MELRCDYYKSLNKPPGGLSFLDFCMGLIQGGLKTFLVACHIPLEVVLQISSFLMAQIQAIRFAVVQ